MTEQALVRVDHNIQAIETMGKYIAQSGLFGVKNPTQAIALMLIAQAEGRHPASAAQDYHVIQNRPSLKADTMLSRFQAAGGKVEWAEYTDTRVVGKFSHPQGGTLVVDWDMDRAKKAGLGTKDNWKHYPRAMLRARVISEGIRTVYPAVLGGMYTPEEVVDFSEPEPTNNSNPPIDVTPLPKELDEDAQFEALVSDRGIGEATRPYLDEYLDGLVETTGKTLSEIKAACVKKPDKFYAGFQAYLSEQLGHTDADIVLELDGLEATEGGA